MARVIRLEYCKDTEWDDAARAEYLRTALASAAEVILAGGVVIVPTETVYGVAVNALDEKAVRRVFTLKGRAPEVPLPVQVASVNDARRCVLHFNDVADRLMQRFMPGPLTIVLHKADLIPDMVTAGRSTVGIRIPDHCVTLELLRLCRIPLVMTSANRSGDFPLTTGAGAIALFGDVVDVVVDGDARSEFGCREGAPSTVVDLTRTPPAMIRAGPVSIDSLREFLPDLVVHHTESGSVSGG